MCKLKDFVPSKEQLLDGIPEALEQAGLTVQEADISDAEQALQKDYFKNTKVVDLAKHQRWTADPHPSTGTVAPGSTRVHKPVATA